MEAGTSTVFIAVAMQLTVLSVERSTAGLSYGLLFIAPDAWVEAWLVVCRAGL